MSINELYEIEYDDDMDIGPVIYPHQIQRMCDDIQRPIIWNGTPYEPHELAEHLLC